MIVNPTLSKGYYGKHDIGVAVGGSNCAINGTVCAIWQGEYIVLEGYVPIKKTKKVLAVKSNDDYIDTESNVLGTPVLMKDVKGNSLNVGDVVKVYRDDELVNTAIIVKRKDGAACLNRKDYSDWECNGISNYGNWIVLHEKYTNLELGDRFYPSSYKIVEIEVEDND